MQRRAFAEVIATGRTNGTKTGPTYPNGLVAKPPGATFGPVLGRGLVAGAVGGVLSGLPSTGHALLTGGDPLAAARAAGNLLLPADSRPGQLLVAGGVAHVAVSLGWGTVLAVAVRRSSLAPITVGVLAGLIIAAVDLGLVAHGPVGRRWPLIRALPVVPQVADHVAFGAIAGAVLARRG